MAAARGTCSRGKMEGDSKKSIVMSANASSGPGRVFTREYLQPFKYKVDLGKGGGEGDLKRDQGPPHLDVIIQIKTKGF